MVLDGIETVNPLGAENVKAKVADPQPTSLLLTPIAYLSCWPGMLHDPGDAHAQVVLAMETKGALEVHPEVPL